MWLAFHKEILSSLLETPNALLVCSEGLGLFSILKKCIDLYTSVSVKRNLVFVLNAGDWSDSFLSSNQQHRRLHVLTNKTPSQERGKLYHKGGVFLVTNRILVMDLLEDRVPIKLITGFLINEAHKISDTSLEEFILRIYRTHNQDGFLKAFSEKASFFSDSFAKCEQVLKILQTNKLLLYPRCHPLVSSSFDNEEPNVIELEEPLTPLMKQCQEAILVAIDSCCLSQLRKINKQHSYILEENLLKIESVLLKTNAIRSQLEPVWHRLSWKTKQIVSDLILLRQLLTYLTRYDAVTFHSFLTNYKQTNETLRHPPLWLFTEAADQLYVASKRRLYEIVKKQTRNKNKSGSELISSSKVKNQQLQLCLEPNPKWGLVKSILEEIDTEMQQNNNSSTLNKKSIGGVDTLIMARDENTVAQLREYLSDGSVMMKNRFYKYLRHKFNATKRQKSSQINTEFELLLETTMRLQSQVCTEEIKEDAKPTKKRKHDCSEAVIEELSSEQQMVVCCYDERLHNELLDQFRPINILLVDPDVHFIRQLEIYHASSPRKKEISLYFLVYENSVDQQTYLTQLQREKKAFEKLSFKIKQGLIPTYHYHVNQQPRSQYSLDTRTTKNTISQKIIIDVREFRSTLPSMLHRAQFQLQPITLDIGDYLVTNHICVERKSISDLFSSFASGRLFTQVENMVKFYEVPTLLIEFTPGKSFSLQDSASIGSDISSSNICSKLALLILHFPKLRVLWSRSPHATVELFVDLKKGKHEPLLLTGSSSSNNNEATSADKRIELQKVKEMLLKLPGVTQFNYRKIMKNVTNLRKLSLFTLQDFEDLLGDSKNSKLLHNFFNTTNY